MGHIQILTLFPLQTKNQPAGQLFMHQLRKQGGEAVSRAGPASQAAHLKWALTPPPTAPEPGEKGQHIWRGAKHLEL